MESIEMGWPEISGILGLRDTTHIHVNITVYKIC
jgi:hypothetical protein